MIRPSLLNGWALYFDSLAMPSYDLDFDDYFKALILSSYTNYHRALCYGRQSLVFSLLTCLILFLLLAMFLLLLSMGM